MNVRRSPIGARVGVRMGTVIRSGDPQWAGCWIRCSTESVGVQRVRFTGTEWELLTREDLGPTGVSIV